MSHFANSRQRQSRGRRALGLFVAVWLNLSLQPCAMAYEADDQDHDCPHCPPAATHEHGNKHAGMDRGMPCADGMADCAIDADWSHDGRGANAKLKDAPADAPAAIVPTEAATRPPPLGSSIPPPRFLTLRPGAPPPLHVLYCVYLD